MNFMQFKISCVLCFVCAIGVAHESFGPFKMSITSMSTCKGPKAKSCTDVEIDWTDMNAVRFKVRVNQPVSMEKGRMSSTNKDRPSTNLVWRFDNPCTHFFMGPIIKAGYNVTNNHCALSMGLYDYKVNYTQITTKFAGNKFFYGNYTVQVILTSNTCNVICYSQVLTLDPKK